VIRKLIYLMTAFTLMLASQSQALAQSTLIVDEVTAPPNSTGNAVGVTLNSPAADRVAGVEFTVRNPSSGTVTADSARLGARLKDGSGNPLNGFQVSFTASGDSIKVVLVSLSGNDRTIPAGTDPIVEILYTTTTGGPVDLTLENIVLSDPNGNSLPFTPDNGKITLNATPVLADIEQIDLAYTENDSVAVTETITVTDVDNQMTGATVAITSGYLDGEDVLAVTGLPVGISGGFNASTGMITLSGDATPDAYQAALRLVTYKNTSDDPNTGNRVVTFIVNDGVGGLTPIPNVPSDPESRTIVVTPVNDAPVVATNTGLTVSESSTGNVISNAALNEGDPDDNGAGLTHTVATLPANGTLKNDGTALAENGTFTQADIDSNAITYDHDGSETTTDSFVFSLADGREDGVAAVIGQTFNITVTPVNDPPTFTSGTPPNAEEGQPYSFDIDASDPEGNGIKFTLDSPAPTWLSINSSTGVLSGTPTATDVAFEVAINVSAVDDGEPNKVATGGNYNIAVNKDATDPLFSESPGVQEIKVTSAAIEWTSNEETTAKVGFGIDNLQTSARVILATAARADTVRVNTAGTEGRVVLTPLTGATVYSATVVIIDGAGNETVSEPVVWATLANPDTLAPVFEVLPILAGRNQTTLTFKWTANEAAKGVMRIVREDGVDLATVITDSTSTFSKTGELTIKGLTANKVYEGQLDLVDASGNRPGPTGSLTNNPSRVEGRTRAVPDNSAPVITQEAAVDASDKTADLSYGTNEEATTIIQYGLTTALGLTFSDTTNFVIDHSVRLTGLAADTTYFFRIGGKDRAGNPMTFTAITSFNTDAAPDIVGPLFNKGPSLISITDVSSILRWANNEAASFELRVVEIIVAGTTDTLRVSAGDLRSDRTVTLSDLTPNTEYKYLLQARDGFGNFSAIREGTFKTRLEVDTTPPRLAGLLELTPDSSRVRVSWTTNEGADSRGEIGTALNLSDTTLTLLDIANDGELRTQHELSFTGLTPETRYYLILKSLDANGNALTLIDSVLTLKSPDKTAPSPASIVTDAGKTRALIKWATTEASNSRVLFGTVKGDVDAADLTKVDVASDPNLVTNHSVTLTGLISGQKYFYRVISKDAAGNASDPTPTSAYDFTTRASEQILSISGRTEDVTDATTATVQWTTNVPATSTVLFGVRSLDNSPPNLDNRVEDDELVKKHEISLTNLTPGTTYQLKVSSTNGSGLQTTEDPGTGTVLPTITTRTAADVLPPLLTRRPVSEYKANNKVIVTWGTDEKATSVVYYKPDTDAIFTKIVGQSGQAVITNHKVTLSNLDPATNYDFVIESQDAAGNTIRFPSTAVVFKVGPGLFKITGISQLGIGSFTTNQAPDTQAPVILSGPVVTSTNTNQVTLNWATDELSTSTVNFGTGGNTDQKVEEGSLVTNHSVTITGLSASTVYSYAVSSTDPNNNGPSTSTQAVAQTSASADVTAPVISNIQTSSTFVSAANGASATITWDTNEASDTQVEFGTTVALGQTKTQSESVTSHSITITRLSPNTAYSYRVASTDASGNGPSVSSIATFTTTGTVDTSPPTFSNINTTGTSHIKVEVSWNTNENASSTMLVINAAGDTSKVEAGALTTTHTLAVTDANFIAVSTAYTVVLQGEDGTGNLGTSSSASVATKSGPDAVAPFAPTNLSATPGNTVVKLDWSAVNDAGLAGYNVFKDGSPVASNLTNTTFTVTGLTNDTATSLEVRAIDQAGNLSFNNPSVSATPALTAAPSKPIVLGTFEGGTEVTTVSLKPILVVGNVTPVDGRATPTYTFAVYTDAGLTNLVTSISGISEGTTTNPTHWQVSDATLTDGIVLLDATTYVWRSRANDGITDSPWSDTKTFTTSASKPTAIQLAGFAAESDRGIVEIRWQTYSNLGLRGFNVYRGLNPGGPFELISGEALISPTESEYLFEDRHVAINVTYYYQVDAINQDEAPQTFGPITVKVAPPNTFTLDQNFPNPFNPTTSVRYELPVSGQVQLMVYNLLGQAVVTLIDGPQQAGFHTVTWNGQNQSNQAVASGVYFYRIVVTGDDEKTFTRSKKMLLLK
jgi:hypothetical protein